MTSPRERFDILNNFLGFGHPSAPIWFIGLEEAGGWSADPTRDAEMYRLYARGWFHLEPGTIADKARSCGRRYTKVYEIMSKIVVAVLGETCAVDWRAYRDQRLFVEGGEVFQANLYPLGKKSLATWPSEYRDLFDISSIEAYYSAVRETRLPLLRHLHEQSQPRITICFGKTAWPDFMALLNLGHGTREARGVYFVYSGGVVLSPFFSYRSIRNADIAMLGDHLKSYCAGEQRTGADRWLAFARRG